MTADTVGSPDWLRPTPSINAPLYSQTYTANATTVRVGPFSAVGYDHIAIVWQPVEDQYCHVTHLDQNGAPTTPPLVKEIVCSNQATAYIMVPILLGAFRLDFFTIAGTPPCTGNLTIARINGSDRRDAILGPKVVQNDSPVNVPANGQVQRFLFFVAEGPGMLSMNGQPVGNLLNVWALDNTGVYNFLGQAVSSQANIGVNVPLWIPPRQLRVDYVNAGAAANNMFGSLTVGG